MATWTDLSAAFGYGTKLTSANQQQLRDNITALAEGASGAPEIWHKALINYFAHVCAQNSSQEHLGNASPSADTWAPVAYGYFYIPADGEPANISFSGRIKAAAASGTLGMRLLINAVGSGTIATRAAATSYGWTSIGVHDISGLTASTWYEISIEIRNTESTSQPTLREFHIWWG
ncbi:MAG: hypothetical protein ACYS8Y_08595 [Planctomycetota bacterium]|jgi:hypothetical protein